jgi:ABC-type antimicrobial peptide transport system permease subunit
MFTAEQRTKEIGIRKVVGASVFAITSLITRDFIKLILLGIAIGVPIAWLVMNKWLINYEYRIDMPWWAFVTTGSLIIGIALLTISYESIKVALVNPIESLKTE